jgi:hypothetical protein
MLHAMGSVSQESLIQGIPRMYIVKMQRNDLVTLQIGLRVQSGCDSLLGRRPQWRFVAYIIARTLTFSRNINFRQTASWYLGTYVRFLSLQLCHSRPMGANLTPSSSLLTSEPTLR